MFPHLPLPPTTWHQNPGQRHGRVLRFFTPASELAYVAVVGRSSSATFFHATAVANRCMHCAHKGPNASAVCVVCATPHQGMPCGPASHASTGCMSHAQSLSCGGSLQGVCSKTANVTATKEKAGQAPVQSPMEGGPRLGAFRERRHVVPRL